MASLLQSVDDGGRNPAHAYLCPRRINGRGQAAPIKDPKAFGSGWAPHKRQLYTSPNRIGDDIAMALHLRATRAGKVAPGAPPMPPPRSPHQRRGLLRSKACRPTSARSRWRQMFVLLKRCWRHHPTPQPSKPDLLDAREVAGSKARTSMILVKGSKRSEHSRSAAVTAHARGDDSATLGPPAAAVMLPDKMVYLYLRTPEVCKCCSYSIVNEDNS